MRITLAESAICDLEEIREWYSEQEATDVGLRIVSEIVEQVEHLAVHPEKGRIVPEFGQSFLRELLKPPFRIVYRLTPETVQVVRVWRSERILKFPKE